MIIKIKSAFKILFQIFISFHIFDLSIGNADINWQIITSGKMTFPAFATKLSTENQQKKFF